MNFQSADVNVPMDGEDFFPYANSNAFSICEILIDVTPNFPEGAYGLWGSKKKKDQADDERARFLSEQSGKHDEADAYNGLNARTLLQEANDLIAQAVELEAIQLGFVNIADLEKAEKLRAEAQARLEEADRHRELSDKHHKLRVTDGPELTVLERQKLWREKKK